MSVKRIPVSRLRPGMYVVNPGYSWVEEPLLYMQEGIIPDAQAISSIVGQGFTEAVYDPARSLMTPAVLSPPAADAPAAAVPLAQEMPLARAMYATAVSQIRQCMEQAPSGELDMSALSPSVSAIVRSLARNANAMLTLANLKSRDEYTYRHSVDVAVFGAAFARYLGLSAQQQHLVGMAGMFHDYGKAMIPVEILNAPRKLTPEEFSVMRTHVLLGCERLRQLPGMPEALLDGIAQHHEKHDGTGYPYGLSGRQISLFGRILSVCDVYDALSSKRPYKDAVSPHFALSIMYRMDGTAWMPGHVEQFIKMIGIYPAGTAVLLSDGRRGIVGRVDSDRPVRPDVLLVKECRRKPSPAGWLDLTCGKSLSIVRPLAADEIPGWDIPSLLGRAEPPGNP